MSKKTIREEQKNEDAKPAPAPRRKPLKAWMKRKGATKPDGIKPDRKGRNG